MSPSSPTPTASASAGKKGKKKEKKPSVLLVNYYGALFLAIVGAFLLAGWTILRPRLDEYKTLQAQAASKREQLQNQQSYLDSLNQSIAAANEIPEEVLADVEEALPSEVGIPELLTVLSEIAKEQGVKLGNVQFSPPATPAMDGAVQNMEISMNLSSPSYATTRRYLDALERNLRLFDIQTISLASGQGETGQVYVVQLRTYLLPPSVRP